MNLARVIGHVWATRKVEGLEGASFRIIQPIDGRGAATGDPIAAYDSFGAGPGEVVTYVTAYEAVVASGLTLVPLDAAITGIVERLDRDDPALGRGPAYPADLAADSQSGGAP